MSKLHCRCGNVIRTEEQDLSYAAALVPDRLYNPMADQIFAQIASFAVACKTGTGTAEWTAAKSPYPEVVEELFRYEVLGKAFLENSREVYQCKRCGRIHIETAEPNHFRSFLPESDASSSLY
ncbi:hypothetical protein [Hymenobacter lucidus]|uniref:Uncharacterized protein n=1 Tax=Hymenobacter lucidus TaxID=2880930 RepID=A0ABS8AV59_9BACT|nr:hypothetical protein [Hymenobacter lucidus]MCB2408621.1 hypothetical protein [Hymenobacter lucidus]